MYQTDKTAILLATYGGELYLRDQLDSILRQTYTEWEIFAHDDGSTDSTPEILREYADRYPEKIHIVEGPATGGAKNNFFFLMRSVDAPYVLCCDQDDVWLEDRVGRFMDAMLALEKENGADKPLLVFSDLAVVDKDLKLLSDSLFAYSRLHPERCSFPSLLMRNVVTGCAMIINRKLCRMAADSSSSEDIFMHDWWCALIASYFGALSLLPESTIFYRQHGDNTLGAVKVISFRYIHRLFHPRGRIKKTIRITRNQAGAFADAFSLGEDSLARRYSRVGELPKLARLRFHTQEHITKPGVIRNVVLFFYC